MMRAPVCPLRFRIHVLRMILAVMVCSGVQAAASTEKALHLFSSQRQGAFPVALISDSTGNLFGVTEYGGEYNQGTVFEFAPAASGGWTETVLHSFAGGSDGSFPYQPVLDAEGNIYGATGYGGVNCGDSGCGTVIKLARNSKGSWTESVLYSFQSSEGYPTGALVVDRAGNIYGAESNYAGATFSVFELTESRGTWNKTILFSFSGGTIYGVFIPALTMDASGNIYGTLTNSVSATQGLVFELVPVSGGSWAEKTLYDFAGGTAGGVPTGPLFLRDERLYGTTLNGGEKVCENENGGCGVVYELTPAANGAWLEKTIYTFQGNDSDGPIYPAFAGFNSSGNLYGFTKQGGAGSCSYCGSVFQLTPNGNGSWAESDLWDFDGRSDGAYPTAVALTPTGQVYGTNENNPVDSEPPQGSIFELTPQSSPSSAWTFTLLYIFPFTDGTEPYTGVTADAAGNLYGTTWYGGVNNVGAVYELSPVGTGWKESMIYSFGPASGEIYFSQNPSRLTLDAQGNLYGTTGLGGASRQGSVFEVSPVAGGGWQEQDLVSFAKNSGFGQPIGGVVFDGAGNMYAATAQGGANSEGAIFEVSKGSGGQWTASIIYSFRGYPEDGAKPQVGLTMDAEGNLYGTTAQGGAGSCLDQTGTPLGCGTVFQLTNVAGTGWMETVLHSFLGSTAGDGASPMASITLDGAGNLYGTTADGGVSGTFCVGLPSGCGTVFELSPSAGGWNETILFEFTGLHGDGANPEAGVTFGAGGILYGTTSSAGGNRYGMLYSLTPSSGAWTESVLHNFGNGSDGKFPSSTLVLGAGGKYYGTTAVGGAAGAPSNNGQGTVFEFIP